MVELEKIIETYAPSINIFTSSHSSQEEGFILDKLENKAVKQGEETQLSVKKDRETKEEPREEMKNVKIVKQFQSMNIFSKADLLEAMKGLKEPAPFADLQALFPGEPVADWLGQLKAEGEVYEPHNPLAC